MLFGNARDEGFVLGDEILEVVNSYSYLGFLLSNEKDIFASHKRQKELGMLQMMGILRCVTSKHAAACQHLQNSKRNVEGGWSAQELIWL